MTGLSVAIQHVPHHADRRQWVQAITTQLRRENPNVPVTVVEDTEREGCWPTYRRTLEAAGDASHHIALQDDLALCKDFLRSVEGAIRARPNNLITLYTHAKAVLKARRRGESWIEQPGVSIATIWPRPLIDAFLTWHDKHIDQALEWDTVRVSMWLIKNEYKAFATVPSLTEHLGWNASILGLNAPHKVATWFIGRDRSAADIDWSQGRDAPLKGILLFEEKWWEYYHE